MLNSAEVLAVQQDIPSEQEIEYIKKIVAIFAQKWTMNILVTLAQNGDGGVGFNELMKKLNGISAAVLSSRLKHLNKWGYVEREVRTGPPTRTIYRLSKKGASLREVAEFIIQHRNNL
jgi:DNA-binding HxlR family transcriptional regulator